LIAMTAMHVDVIATVIATVIVDHVKSVQKFSRSRGPQRGA